jgi:hypothetical protein
MHIYDHKSLIIALVYLIGFLMHVWQSMYQPHKHQARRWAGGAILGFCILYFFDALRSGHMYPQLAPFMELIVAGCVTTTLLSLPNRVKVPPERTSEMFRPYVHHTKRRSGE